MGYQNNRTGEYEDIEEGVVVLDTVTYTTAGAKNGAALEVGGRTTGMFTLVCSALTASDTLDAKIQTSSDASGSGLGTWRDVATFTQITATSGSQRISGAGLDRFIRAVITPTDAGGGGISATVKVTADLKG